MFSVGLFLLVGLAIVGWMIISFGQGNKVSDAKVVTVEFTDASGIIEGGIVRLAGANVGEVVNAPRLNSNHLVEVDIAIRKDLKIPTNARFKITPLSLLGDKAIYIYYPETPSRDYIESGDVIRGISPRGLEQLQTQAEELTQKMNMVLEKSDAAFEDVKSAIKDYQVLAQELNISIKRLNNSVLSEDSLVEFNDTLSNLNTTSEVIGEFSTSLKPLVGDTKIAITKVLAVADKADNVVASAEELMQTTNTQIASLAPAIEKLPETLDIYNETGKSLKKVSVSIEKALNNEDSLVSTLTADSEINDDAKSFVKNLKNNGILGYKDSQNAAEDPRDRYRGLRR